MSTPTASEIPPTRPEPQRLKPTTLPHSIILDAGANGAAGERIDAYDSNVKSTIETLTPTPSTTDLLRTYSQSSSQTDLSQQENAGGYSAILLISLRIAFYLAVVLLALVFTLAACKFTKFWDPCESLYINTTQCKVTSYMKGMIYHEDCTEEHYCILPGFQSNVKRQAWSLHKPNNTVTVSASKNQTIDNPGVLL